jgi:CheY-like chemotaxis protein
MVADSHTTRRATRMVDLRGVRVLIVEDEALIALAIERQLFDLGCVVAALALHVGDALGVARSLAIDVAVLDINVGGQEVFPVADALMARGIPFVFASGDGMQTIRPDLRHNLLLHKPFTGGELRRALEETLVFHRA